MLGVFFDYASFLANALPNFAPAVAFVQDTNQWKWIGEHMLSKETPHSFSQFGFVYENIEAEISEIKNIVERGWNSKGIFVMQGFLQYDSDVDRNYCKSAIKPPGAYLQKRIL